MVTWLWGEASELFGPIQDQAHIGRNRILLSGLYEQEMLAVRAHVEFAISPVKGGSLYGNVSLKPRRRGREAGLSRDGHAHNLAAVQIEKLSATARPHGQFPPSVEICHFPPGPEKGWTYTS